MSVILHLQDVEEIFFNSDSQTYLTDKAGTQELLLNYNHRFLKGTYTEIILPNFKISYGNSVFKENTALLFESNDETVEMHFTICGVNATFINGFNKNFGVQTNTHNIYYGNELKGKMIWETNEMFIFEVNLSPAFFKNYLPNTNLFNSFEKKIDRKEVGSLSEHNHTITPQMLFIINKIIHCNFKDEFRRLFLEAKVLELLMLQMEQIKSFKTVLKEEKPNSYVIDKMHYAKELILQKIDNPLSLSELSTVLHTNECSLKKDFKAVFGNTVFGYIKEQKMKKAKYMLLENNYTVSEVADIIGYKNPQHFTTAFKKYYGFVPSDLLIK